MEDFAMVFDRRPDDLGRQISKFIKLGWVLYGNPFPFYSKDIYNDDTSVLCQMLVKWKAVEVVE